MKSIMKQYPVGSFFVLAYAISWVLWVPIVLYIRLVLPPGQDPGWLMLPMLLGTYAPTVAATIVTLILEGKQGVKKLWAKFLGWRVGFRWWLATFFLMPILILAAMGIYALQGGTLGHFDPSFDSAVLDFDFVLRMQPCRCVFTSLAILFARFDHQLPIFKPGILGTIGVALQLIAGYPRT